MKANELAQLAIQKMNKRITNEIFLIIQNDKNLMYDYLKIVEQIGSDSLNRSLGKEIKNSYGLKNLEDREDNPSCTIIQNHMKFE